ncbi:MAG TPA: DegT/DnrJ/EryC1/StrS family aminotransferase [Anaerolineae bacterium]|nr:DegT/DnrJ/EryC1/StrS family aminotransferase [Anaerolineae bacterium]
MRRFLEIPAEDLTRQYQQVKYEIWAAMETVLPTGKYTLGPTLRAFEGEFAAYCGVRYCLGIANGTEALHLALAALDIGPGDEVITVANTYVATAFAVSYVGATPVFVDIDPVTYTIDPSKVEEKITDRTRAIIPVHHYGHPADMDPILEIARQYGLTVIEDAAQSHGALYKGRKTGSLADMGCFSFYPSKNLGCYGDGGGITLNDPELYDKLQVLRYMGQHVKHIHEIIGFQQRLDPLQAAILRVKLRHLETWNEDRRRWAALYNELLADLPVVLPMEKEFAKHVYYMYTIRCQERDALRDWLTARGIETQIIYPIPVPLQKAYQHLGYKEEDIPIAAQYAKELLCLPMFPELREEEVRAVAEAVREFFASRS